MCNAYLNFICKLYVNVSDGRQDYAAGFIDLNVKRVNIYVL